MKTLITLLLFSFMGFSQSIIVDTSTYTPAQLVNSVLINSPCVSTNNVSARTGTNFGSVNGIGYFTNSNPNFPFTSGVILTTGDATKAPSPNDNILSDGNMAWTGDDDLEANILSQSGLVMNSINATVLEFDFTPKTPNFDFDFLFASEEYGTSQCNYSDAFAFLLTDLTTGITTNIAVIPSTNIPVSVETIRNNIYNENCPSANPAYFGRFNVSGFGPAINFNGQTIQMSATSTVLTTHQYHIKLVIADGGNNVEYDSAIFIEGNSLNIGQNVLGLDYTIANGKGSCLGGTLPTLSAAGLDPATTFVWKKGNTVIAGETTSILDLNTATLPSPVVPGQNTFSVTYTEPGCVAITDTIIVEVYPEIKAITNVPTIYESCSTATTFTFDLTKNTTILLNSNTPANTADDLPANTLITYYLTNNQAISGNTTDQLPTSYSTTNPTTPVYVRIQNPATNCYVIRSFNLEAVPTPVIMAPPTPMVLCANGIGNPPKAIFNLDAAKASVLGTQDPIYNIISFHATQNGANTNTDVIIPDGSNNILTESATIYIRIQNISKNNCFATASLQLTVTPLPAVDMFPNIVVCTSYTLPPLNQPAARYWTAPDGTGTQLSPGDIITADTTIYIYANVNGCINQSSFDIKISDLPEITPINDTHCTEYKLPFLPYGGYFTEASPNGIELPIGTLITETTSLYVRFEDTTITPSCVQERPFTVGIIPFTPLPAYSNRFSCNSYTLPADVNGGTYYAGPGKTGGVIAPGTPISSTTVIYVYKESSTSPLNCTSEKTFTVYITLPSLSPPVDLNSCSSYTLPVLPIGQYWTGPAGTGIQYNGGDIISATTTLYFYVPGESCTDNSPFTITVIIPPLPAMPDVQACELYYLPAVSHSGNYYTGSQGTGNLLPVNTQISTTQTIYFYDKAATGPCYVEEQILIKINPAPPIDTKPAVVAICNGTYTLGDLINGEYYEFPGGLSPTNPILPPGTIITASKTIYIRAEAIAPSICSKEYSVDVVITTLQVTDIPNVYSCDSYILPAITGPGNYYTLSGGPSAPGNTLKNPGDPINITTTLYVYADNANRLLCSDEDAFTVTIYNTPTVNPVTNPNPQCGFYILPPYNTFTSTPANSVNQYYTLSGGADTPGNIRLFPGDSITASKTIYVSAAVGTPSTKICLDEKPLQVTIIPLPVLDPFTNIDACNTYTLPILTVGNYYQDAAHTLPIINKTLTTSQTVYIYAETGTAPFICTADASFIVDINTEPMINAVPRAMITVCDVDSINDFKADFDLDSLTATILGTQDPALFGVAYYESLNDITSDTPITTDGSTATDANLSVVYFKVYNLTGAQCSVTGNITLNVIPFPASDPLKGIICIEPETGAVQSAIVESNYSSSVYTFSWTDTDGNEISTAPTFVTNTPGVYSLTITAKETVAACESDPIQVTVIESAKPAKVTFKTSGWFSDNQTVTVTAIPYVGDGSNFLYSLDGNTPQISNIFTNVSGDTHEITVSDSNGCGSLPLPISIHLIDSPKFFTPNADGYNDTWKIVGLEDQTQATLFIFDRFGKLLKQLFLNGEGWDGTFNGQPMPATDYWFNIKYVEEGITKEYRSHFSLVR